MSARAASRLATLGFRHVYRYQAGNADWFSAGLPREGDEAHTPRVADVARTYILKNITGLVDVVEILAVPAARPVARAV